MYSYTQEAETLEGILESIYGILFLGAGIAELGVLGISIVAIVIISIVVFIIAFAAYLFKSYAIYNLSKKLSRPFAWLAWIPIFGSCFRIYVLSDIAAEKEFNLFDGKIKLQNRLLSFWIYAGISVLGTTAISIVIGTIGAIPVLGQVAGVSLSVLYLVPSVACAFMEYVYLKDALDVFKTDSKSNQTIAIVITVIDSVLANGLAGAIYLFTLRKAEPIVAAEPEYTAEYEQVRNGD